ncbi:restriction endonuclease subunit S [Campylobacter lanienae]|nr:restriction endonuclease subunit S [Campylobacter lanienae]
MNKIPKGWEVKKLGEICILDKGKIENCGELPYLEVKFLRNLKNADIKEKGIVVEKNQAVILVDGENSGEVFKVKTKGYLGSTFRILKLSDNVNFDYFIFFMNFVSLKFKNSKVGSAIPHLNKKLFNECEIPLPNLVEQKAVADKLDDSFAKIENAITNLINAKENLKLYKQSVLKSAFNGDLLPNASPTHWEVKKLGEICEINPKTEILLLNESDEVSFIPMASVEAETNIFTESKSKFSKVKKGYTKFRDNDILFAKITPCMENGKICIVNNLKFGIGFGSTEFHVIRPNKNTLSKYIYYFVSQISFRQMAQIYMTGAVGQRRVPSKILENFEIPLPPLSEQNLIVAEIDRRFAIVDKTLNLIDTSIQNAKNLKQSILKKAFSGELRSEI